MSDYGADSEPNIPAAQDLAFTKKVNEVEGGFVNQWTNPDEIVTRQLVSNKGHTNIHFVIQQ